MMLRSCARDGTIRALPLLRAVQDSPSRGYAEYLLSAPSLDDLHDEFPFEPGEHECGRVSISDVAGERDDVFENVFLGEPLEQHRGDFCSGAQPFFAFDCVGF
jgi:hypothetical protein